MKWLSNPPMIALLVSAAAVLLDGVMKTIAFTLLMLGLLVAGQNMPDHSGEKSAADDAIAQQRLADHVAAVSKTICGENGVLRATDTEGSFVCVTKRGFVTKTKGVL